MAIERSPDSIIRYFDALNDIPSSIFGIPSTETILHSTLGQMEVVRETNVKGYPLVLFADGCDWGGPNKSCNVACGNPNNLFAGPERWWTCLSLAALALEWSFFNISQSVTAEIDAVLSKVGVNNISDFDGINVLNKTVQCVFAYQLRHDSKEPFSVAEPGVFDYNREYDYISLVCPNFDVDLSIDIAGSGVLISYVTQGIIAIASWALIRIFTIRAAIDCFAGPFLRFERINESFSERHTRLASALQRIEQSNLSHATSALLVEFQEAQCFFIFAIAIALLYADSRVVDLYGVTSWQSLAATKFWLEWLASQGIWSIILTQISLRYTRLDSIYSLVLSTTAIVLIATAAATTMNPDPKTVYKILHEADVKGYEECGYHPSLDTFCLSDATLDYPKAISIFSNIQLLLIYVLLWWEKLSGTAVYNLIVRTGSTMRINSLRTVLAKFKDAILELKIVLVTVVELWIVSNLGISLNLLILSMYEDPRSMGLNTGQVISMLVWAPVIAKYLHLIGMGIEKGFKMRIPGVFAVLKIQDPAQTEHSERAQSFSSGAEQTHTE